jgi:hypothetical protein
MAHNRLGAEEHVNNHTKHPFPMGRSLPIGKIINKMKTLNSECPAWPTPEAA